MANRTHLCLSSSQRKDDHDKQIVLTVEVIAANIMQAATPVAVIGRFQDLTLCGLDRQCHQQISGKQSREQEFGGKLSELLDHGVFASHLGQLFLIPYKSVPLSPTYLLLAGMGEVGEFGPDELRLLMTNITMSLAIMGYDEFATVLIGVGNRSLSHGVALPQWMQGIVEGLQHSWPHIHSRSFRVKFYENNCKLVKHYCRHLNKIIAAIPREKDNDVQIKIQLLDSTFSQSSSRDQASPNVYENNSETNTVRRVDILSPSNSKEMAIDISQTKLVFRKLQYSAISDDALLSVREIEIQDYFAKRLPHFLNGVTNSFDSEIESFGRLVTNYLVPNDIQNALFNQSPITLVVDRRTAALPWEVAVKDVCGETRFLGVNPGIVRQFRTPVSGRQAVAPVLNKKLSILIIADPAGGKYRLPNAAKEGFEVALEFDHINQKWGGILKIQITLRIGCSADKQSNSVIVESTRSLTNVVKSAKPCDPMEVLSQIVNGDYDIIHYAGHSVFENGRAGWLFGEDCVFSASELMRLRRAPRLVFANACHSSDIGADQREDQLSEQASLAEAFFGRGVKNYIGTGWQVQDDKAREIAVTFYQNALNYPKPAVLGEALRIARKKCFRDYDSTWAAYQHYGQWNDRLINISETDIP